MTDIMLPVCYSGIVSVLMAGRMLGLCPWTKQLPLSYSKCAQASSSAIWLLEKYSFYQYTTAITGLLKVIYSFGAEVYDIRAVISGRREDQWLMIFLKVAVWIIAQINFPEELSRVHLSNYICWMMKSKQWNNFWRSGTVMKN